MKHQTTQFDGVKIDQLTPVSASDSNKIICTTAKPGSIQMGARVILSRAQCGFDVNLRVEMQASDGSTMRLHDAPFTQSEKAMWLQLYDAAAMAEDRRREAARAEAVNQLRELGVF